MSQEPPEKYLLDSGTFCFFIIEASLDKADERAISLTEAALSYICLVRSSTELRLDLTPRCRRDCGGTDP